VRTFCHRFEPGPEVDLIEVSHNGYAAIEEPVFHRRRVLWFKPGVWLVDDLLTGVGSHTYDLSFNFAPRPLTVDGEAPHAFRYQGERVRVRLLPLLNEGLQARALKGSLAPKGGWVSYGYGVKVPAPQVIYTRTGPLPARFVTAVIWEGRGEVQVEDGEGELGLGLAVRSGAKSWRLTLGGPAQDWALDWA